MPPVEPRRELTQSDEILIPSQEQEYESLEAAQHAAERYARSVNTVVIVKRTTKDKHGNVVQKDLACERQGSYIGTAKKTPEAYNIRTKRCGCPWMISVGFSKKRGNRDGKRGRFTKLSLEHNHPLQPLPEDAPAGPSKLTLKDLRSGQTSVPKPEISASTSSRTQTSRARSSASKSAAAAAQELSSESSGPVKTNAAKGRGKDLDKENNESKGDAAASLDESRQLSNYNMATFLPQAAILSSDRVSTVPSVSLPAGLQPSSNALGPLSSDVMSALGANAHDIHRPLQGIGRTDITWDDLKTQMSHIPWDLQSDAMKALMDVLQLTLQTYQVPTIGSNRHADAEASAAATAAAIADVVGSLPANYNPSTSHTQEQPHSHQPIQQPQAQAPPPPPTSFARHHNLSSSRAGPSAMEGISHNLAGTTSTSELLQLHRADTGELNGGRERGHRRQGSSASGPIQGSGSDGSTAIMTSQPPSTQVSTAIPSVVSSLPPSANPTAPSTPSALSTTASPLLTAVPTLRNVIHGHMAPSVEPLQGSFLQHSRQSSHSGAGHHRTQSGSLANVNQGIHALDSNGTLLGHNHSQSNGTSNNSSMDSSPLISQTQTLLDAAARVHNNQSEAQRQAEEQAQIQAQVNADTEAAVNAALNMNALQGPTASGSALSGTANSGHVGSTVSVSNANATSSPIPLNLLDAVSMNTLPNFTQQLLQQQQRLQQLQQQQQQQHQQHQQQHQQQQQQQPQQPVHTHPNDVEKDGGSDLALSEPPRKRVKQEALYAPEQQ
ncbi:hypothetical protein BGZ75_002727 [Mortierella antarctica]|nr:hypothetical protein BGZ75_002727 [Mortierella antarctica]